MSSGPAEIASAAAVLDWPATPDGKPAELRAGTNGWTCFPDNPTTDGPDPMCLDAASMAWADGYLSKKPPQMKSLGLAYMYQGDAGASNTDPWATGPTADNQWHKRGPHVMIFVPDGKALDAITADHTSGGPYVMWKGTAWAHIMMPVR
jgi:hypothetical protein